MLFVNTKSDIGNRYRKTSIGKYRDRIGSNMKISESDRELRNEIGTTVLHISQSKLGSINLLLIYTKHNIVGRD